jgi:S-adenosyl-L-methionine hydrolase (adenosine-forming)
MRPIITLTSDFGYGSSYVAQMKGAILSLCRDVELMDISHAIMPQNVREGAVVLADATTCFPHGAIHVAVVDPGVGTSRRMIYAEIGGQRYIAPDNGLLSLLALSQQPRLIISIENREYWLPDSTSTFQGRDIMAPAAAHLARDLEPQKLGPVRQSIEMLDWPVAAKSAGGIAGVVIYVDSFGNLITNLSRADVLAIGAPGSLQVDCGGLKIRGLVPTYGAALPDEIIALFDSHGRLEIAKVNGNAALDLGLTAGEEVTVLQP